MSAHAHQTAIEADTPESVAKRIYYFYCSSAFFRMESFECALGPLKVKAYFWGGPDTPYKLLARAKINGNKYDIPYGFGLDMTLKDVELAVGALPGIYQRTKRGLLAQAS